MKRTNDLLPQCQCRLLYNEAYDPAQPFTPWACRFALNKARQWIERKQRWQLLLAGGLAEELSQRREELQPELDHRLAHRSLDYLPLQLFFVSK